MIVRNADSDANGEVTLDELQASVSRMNADRFARLDGDGDGVLTAEEFPTPRASNRPRAARRGSRADSFESQKQAAADLLDDADKDGNGAVTLEEVQAAKPGYPAENFEAKDKDNSGTITSEETTPQS
jgi:Ca2+-binding EF-hand superfamily protein